MLASILLKNRKTNKLKKLKKKYTKKSFDNLFLDYKIHFKTMIKDNKKKANLVIMYDLNVPNGEENSKSNKVFVHYLKLGNTKYLKFIRPIPPNGTHNYYSISINLNEKEFGELDSKFMKNMDRKHNIFRNLGKKKIMNIKIDEKNIIRENSFKVSKD